MSESDTMACTMEMHPAASIFPPMEEDAFGALVEDIRQNGQVEPIILFDGKILDGWHRYRACIKLELTPRYKSYIGIKDPIAYVVSLNLHRRHLDQAGKRAVIERLLKENPSQSNRQIASIVGVDDKTVGVSRRNLEATAEIPQLKETTGRDGKRRSTTPAPRIKAAAERPAQREQTKKTAKKQLRDFKRAIETLVDFCGHYDNLNIPKLTVEDAQNAVSDINDAKAKLNRLLVKVKDAADVPAGGGQAA